MIEAVMLQELTDSPNMKRHLSAPMLQLIRKVQGPIVEVGGTTKRLIDPTWLPSRPITTDIEQWPGRPVDIVADGKQLPFQDKSIPFLLADHIPQIDQFGRPSKEFLRNVVGRNRAEQEALVLEQVRKDYARYALSPNQRVDYNLRINLMIEMNRVATPAGLIALGTVNDLDIDVATRLGWDILEVFGTKELGASTVYDILFQTPAVG